MPAGRLPKVELSQLIARGFIATPDGGEQLGLPSEGQGFKGRNLTEVHRYRIFGRQ